MSGEKVEITMLKPGYNPSIKAEFSAEAVEKMASNPERLKANIPELKEVYFDSKNQALVGIFDISILTKCTSQGLSFFEKDKISIGTKIEEISGDQ